MLFLRYVRIYLLLTHHITMGIREANSLNGFQHPRHTNYSQSTTHFGALSLCLLKKAARGRKKSEPKYKNLPPKKLESFCVCVALLGDFNAMQSNSHRLLWETQSKAFLPAVCIKFILKTAKSVRTFLSFLRIPNLTPGSCYQSLHGQKA